MAAAAVGAVLLILCCITTLATATDYTVGDSTGWTNGFDYSTWTSDKTFVSGDTLIFNYLGGVHTVDQVTSTDYSSCSSSNALSTDSSGQTTVALSKAGTYYIICGVAGHCSNGMKLSVSVAAPASSNPPSTPTTPPSTPAIAPPSSDTTPTTTGVKPSAAGIVSPASLVTLIGSMAVLKLVVI